MEQIKQLLALMDRPAFCVKDGRILAANDRALSLQVPLDAELAPLLTAGRDAWAEFRSGYLALELALCGSRVPATVTPMEGYQLFTLEPEDTEPEMRLLSLAAQELRGPLSDVMALAEKLEDDPDRVAGISRGLHRLLRIVGNMTPPPPFRPEMTDVNALLREVWDSTQPACEALGIRFEFLASPRPVFSWADGQLLTRAIHNLLSNSMKFSPGCAIRLQLTQRRGYYHITFRDSGGALPPLSDPFAQALRQPGLEDPRNGLGMGLRLVRTAALSHGGIALVTTPREGGVQVQLSLPVRQDGPVRSNRLRISYTGEQDPLLVELSDVLPPDFYKQ